MVGGELVREARRRAGLTQRELADRAGVSQPAIARVESGRMSSSVENVQRLVRACGLDLVVQLVPLDDSDLSQARPGADHEERARQLTRSVKRMRALREEARG